MNLEGLMNINGKVGIFKVISQAKNMIICDLLNKFEVFKKQSFVCIIGDGYGHLGILIKKLNPDTKIIYINLGKNLLIDSYHYFQIFHDHKPLLLNKNNLSEINNYSVVLIEAENYNILENI